MKETIHLFYTNDLHSYFDNWSQVATFIKSGRMEATQKGETAWTVDIGDHMDRVHPLTEATLGRANVSLLNDLQYDVATLGNNEGITLSYLMNICILCMMRRNFMSFVPIWNVCVKRILIGCKCRKYWSLSIV